MRTSMPPVETCLIGGLDAWGDDNSNVVDAFISIDPYRALAERHRCFLCGRRGSGKSAIAVMSKQMGGWDHYKVIRGEVEQYGEYMALVDDLVERRSLGLSVDIKRAIAAVWRYALRVVVLQETLRVSEVNGGRHIKEAADIRSYLTSESLLTKHIGDILYDVFSEAIAAIEASVPSLVDFYACLYAKTADKAFRKAMAAIPHVLGTKGILVIIDTLESYKIYNEAMRQGLRGIIGTIVDMLTDDCLRSVGIRFFLPAEIFEDISAEIPAKTRGVTIYLQWRSGDLMAMLAKRYLDMVEKNQFIQQNTIASLREVVVQTVAAITAGKSGRPLRRDFWYRSEFLPARIKNRLGQEEDCFAYILRHTQRKPRELIWVMNQIIRKAHEREELPTISAEAVVEGVHDSETLPLLLSDILSPYEGYVDHVVDRARSVFFGKSRVMTGKQLRQFAMALYEVGPVNSFTADEFVHFLLRTGVVGLIHEPDRHPPSKPLYCRASYEYLMSNQIAFSSDRWYYVHPVMGDCFHMQPDNELGSAYPMPEKGGLERELGLSD